MSSVETRLGLFAAREVGLRIAAVFGEKGVVPAPLVLDAADPQGLRDEITAAAGVEAGAAMTFDALSDVDTLARLQAEAPERIVLAWWPYILKPPLLDLPREGYLNLHPSLLPANRGKDYNFWNLVEDVPFGATIHWVDAGVDSGDIAFQAPIAKTWADTGQTLHARAEDALVELFHEHFHAIASGVIPRRAQPAGIGHHRRAELDAASRIALDEPSTPRTLLNLLRARTFPPHPGAWFEDEGQRWEVRVEIRRSET